MTTFTPSTMADRDAATDFVGRVAQLEPTGLVRLVSDGPTVHLWAKAGFGVMATRTIAGRLNPPLVTVCATDLVGALAVSTAHELDPGSQSPTPWRAQLPPPDGWHDVGRLAADDIARHVAAALVDARAAMEAEREHELSAATKATVPPRLLDSALMSVMEGQQRVPISMRMLFALSGMGFSDADPDGAVQVRTTTTWLRLDTAVGSVARRRMADLPPV